MNPLQQLGAVGQSVWLDYIRRGLITSGEFKSLVEEYAVAGVTSNPTIFEKAITGSTDYDGALRTLVERGEREAKRIFLELAFEDIGATADVLRPVYEASQGRDGFACLEVSPELAHDTAGTIEEVQELFDRLGRPNVMIKVPGTAEGVSAIEELTARGVNVNVTLLFDIKAYEQVALAYIRGLERRLAADQPIDRIASVASFFVSRVDTAVDAFLPESSPLRGKAAIANAKVAFQLFKKLFSGPHWERLAAAGARVQRVLWASTGTKNPSYSDVLYIEGLVGPQTVNTMPQSTLRAFADHGRVRLTLEEGLDAAEKLIADLGPAGMDLGRVTARLLEDGVAAFARDFDKLLAAIEAKCEQVVAAEAWPWAALGPLAGSVERRLAQMTESGSVRRIWAKDHTVWKPEPGEIADRLGWLTIPEQMAEHVDELAAFAHGVAEDGFRRVVLLGMGGSSLAPEVLHATFGSAPGYPSLDVLDSTDPGEIAALAQAVDLDRTLFLVASKSGETVETLSHFAYFWAKVPRGERFVAITDPGTPLATLAREHGFRRVFLNPADIGGRYSALSYFGLVPAALIGAPVHALLDQATEMACACASCVPAEENPGAWLGAVIGEAARAGRDKLTLVLPPSVASFGAWVEQLIAESTGKEGKGVLPVEGEPLGPPDVYGDDRLFVSLGDVLSLEPAVSLRFDKPVQLGAEFFRWEFATAVAGAILGINPFDQPNVQEAKEATARLLSAGRLPDPGFDDLGPLLAQVRPGDYIAITAYVPRTAQNEEALRRVRTRLRDRYKVATTVGFGPRYLHSTGQLHKGGPNTGVVIQVMGEDGADLKIPGKPYTFSTLKAAQALGDLDALRAQGRRVARLRMETLLEWEA